jgi:hypothetical protein
LNANVLKLSNVAWRNIHILPKPKMKLGQIVVANHTHRPMEAQLAFEIIEATGRLLRLPRGSLILSPDSAALEKLRRHRGERTPYDDLGDGRVRVVDLATGLPSLDLAPEEVLHFGLEYTPEREAAGHAVRAIQFSLEGSSRAIVGGQTFVVGRVRGFTKPLERLQPWSWWALVAAVASLSFFAWLSTGRSATPSRPERP